MAISETTKNVTYENNNRIATIEQVITRSDDCERLGNLYYRMSDIYRRLYLDIAEEERTALEADLETVKADVNKYIGYLAGYENK